MLYQTTEQLACVQAQNAREFEIKVNCVLAEHTDARVELDRNVPFVAYIFYKTYWKEPETLGDHYELSGCTKTCGDCRHLETTEDKRRKIFPCKHARYGKVSVNAPACDLYYMEAENETTYKDRRSRPDKNRSSRADRIKTV